MRITDNIRFNTAISNLFSTQSQYNDLMEKIASQKKVNRASDDPVAATKIIDIRQGKAANEQYQKNMGSCESWISATESKLSSAYDLLVNAQEIAVGQATATATATTRQIAAQQVQSLIEEMTSLANAKTGNRYLFSGSQTSTQPFSAVENPATIDSPVAADGNVYTGTVSKGGAYTGLSNKTYVFKIVAGGNLSAATYQISSDGGKTWGAVKEDLDTGTIPLGDGIELTFEAGAFAENDVFSVRAYAPGYYLGDNENLSVAINRGTSLAYNISGAEAFTSAGSNGVDVFKTLNSLKDALNSNNVQGISGQLDNLKNAQNQVTLNQSRCGTKANHIEVVKSSLADFDKDLSDLLSAVQDADLEDLVTRLSMKEIALKASYAMASKIGNTTILDFLK
ncbi:MAG: flagellar hook-associated protein FlgL [Pseudomonadota bacterium]